MQRTALQNWETGRQYIGAVSQPPKRRMFSPLVLGVLGFVLLVVLGGAGVVGAPSGAPIFGRRSAAPAAAIVMSAPPLVKSVRRWISMSHSEPGMVAGSEV